MARRPLVLCLSYVALLTVYFLVLHPTSPRYSAAEAASVFVQNDSTLIRILGGSRTPRFGPSVRTGYDTDAQVSLRFGKPAEAIVHVNLSMVGTGWLVQDYTLFLRDSTVFVPVQYPELPSGPMQLRLADYAERARRAGNISGALRILDEGLEANPGDARAWVVRGWANQRKNQFAEALEDFSRAYELDPRNYEAVYGYSAELGRAGQYHKAVEMSNRAIQLRPYSGAPYFVRALAENSLGNEATARDDVRTACRLGSRSACTVMGWNPLLRFLR
jgi:tetratricopeptide (TPR) repeat protein